MGFGYRSRFTKFRRKVAAIILGRGSEHRIGKVPDWVVVLLVGPALPSIFVATGTWPALSPEAIAILTFLNICFCNWILKLLKDSGRAKEDNPAA